HPTVGGEEDRFRALLAVLPNHFDAEFQAHGVIPFILSAPLLLAPSSGIRYSRSNAGAAASVEGDGRKRLASCRECQGGDGCSNSLVRSRACPRSSPRCRLPAWHRVPGPPARRIS